jgi:UDP-glucose 4-epimerase
MNNMVSTDSIINSCVSHNVKRLVYTSSMSVYGYGLGKAFTEEDTPAPIDPYGVSKYACELNIKSAGEQFGLDWCIIRPHNVYGVKQNIWDKYRNVLGIWMYQALNNKPMLIYGDGEQTRAFSYIDDCVWCFWNAATEEIASKEIINLGGIHKCTINFANDVFKDISGYDKVEHKEERYEVKHAVPTFLKSTQILGYEHKTSLRDGISAMWEWAKNQPMRGQYKWENYEIIKGIYSYWK